MKLKSYCSLYFYYYFIKFDLSLIAPHLLQKANVNQRMEAKKIVDGLKFLMKNPNV